MDEFAFIARYLRPLAGQGAHGLADDVAALPGGQIVSKDVLVSGVHFHADDPLDTVAQKALRVNISDIVAKGAKPLHYLLGLVWPAEVSEAEFAQFADGLARDQAAYGLSLLGGDTTRHREGAGGLTISVTMIGQAIGNPVSRAGARPGDDLWVGGVIGDGHVGLRAVADGRDCPSVRAYLCPPVELGFAPLIAAHGTASLDISDGLVADATHLACASGVRLQVHAERVPLSEAGRAFASDRDGLVALLTGGDDYQPLFTAPPDARAALAAAAHKLTRIGAAIHGAAGLDVLDADETMINIGSTGYRHF